MKTPIFFRILIGTITLLLAAGAQTIMAAPTHGETGWPAYNGDYASQRFSQLKQINTHNVGGLKPLCEVKLGEEGSFESGPIVIGDYCT
ncbi:MAG: hypothetical protein ACRESE_05295 [Gammaproteobacteria bacterium]